MKEDDINVITITAPEGMQYANDLIVGKTIYCIKEVQDTFRLITDEEAKELRAALEARRNEQLLEREESIEVQDIDEDEEL